MGKQRTSTHGALLATVSLSVVAACSSSSESVAPGSADANPDTSHPVVDVDAGDSGEASSGLEGGGADSASEGSPGGDGSSSDAANAGGATDGAADASNWNLVWSDEFSGPNGSGIDPTKWAAVTGGGGWGNQELEYYTADLANAQIQNGSLVITATAAGAGAYTCWYGSCQYTSARLQTKGLFEQAYGRFEARIKLPRGQGLWPAFWLLGNDFDKVGWPACGEMDPMENFGKLPATISGSLDGPGYSGFPGALTATYSLPSGAFADAYHVFAIEWEAGVVRFYVDGTLYETRTPADVPAGKTWVFDHPVYLLLNVAVGGVLPGPPASTTVFPQTMLVDYVRVYQ